MGLVTEMDALWSGFGNASALREAFDEALLLVPTAGRDQLVTGVSAGRTWVCAFTSESRYRDFCARNEPMSAWWGTLAVPGARLRSAVAGVDGTIGVAVDLASERPMFFPPNETGEDQNG